MIESVECGHNVIHCASMWLMLLLVLRGAIQGINTIEELFDCDNAQLFIKESMLEMPL